jgi:hypothetical protein
MVRIRHERGTAFQRRDGKRETAGGSGETQEVAVSTRQPE